MVTRPRGHGQQNLQGPRRPYPPQPEQQTLNGIVTGSGPPAAGSGINTQIYVDSTTGAIWLNQGGTWVRMGNSPPLWVVTVGTPGRRPFNGEELFNIPITFNTHLPAGLVGSVGNCEVAPVADAIFTMYKTGTSIGTVRFPAGLVGNNVATFTFSSAVNFTAPTDNFSFVAPSPQEVSLSGMSVQFLGNMV